MNSMVLVTVHNQCLKMKYQQAVNTCFGLQISLEQILLLYRLDIFDDWFAKIEPYKSYPL